MTNMKHLEESTFEECLEQGYFEDKHIVKNPKDNLVLERAYFDNCYFENIDFTKFKVVDINVDNCTFKNCDFSNILFDEKVLFRVILLLVNCKELFLVQLNLKKLNFMILMVDILIFQDVI